MRLLLALLFLIFGSTPTFAAEGSPTEDLLLSPDLERSLATGTPVERREILRRFLLKHSTEVDMIQEDIVEWYAKLPDRGIGVRISPSYSFYGKDDISVVAVVKGAFPQSSAVEQLCPGDVIRSVESVSFNPLEFQKWKDLKSVSEMSLKYVDRVTSLIRSGKGDKVSIEVKRSGKVVRRSPKMNAYANFRESASNRIAFIRVVAMRESEKVELVRFLAENGPEQDLVPAIRMVFGSINYLSAAAEQEMESRYGTPPLCAKK